MLELHKRKAYGCNKYPSLQKFSFFLTSGDSILKSFFTPHFLILKSQPCLYSKGGLYVCLQKIFRLSGEGVGYP